MARGRSTRRHIESQNPTLESVSVEAEFSPGPWYEFDSSRVARARYDADTGILQVAWQDSGTAYAYGDVSSTDWKNFRRAVSPGKWVNRTLNGKPYWPMPDET